MYILLTGYSKIFIRFLTDKEIQTIQEFMQQLALQFAKDFCDGTITIKHHMLVHLVTNYFYLYKTLGLFSEQEMECSHSFITAILAVQFSSK